MTTIDSLSLPGRRIVYIGRIFFAAGLVGIGIQHFIFSAFIPVMIPWWPIHILPGTLWAYIVGALLTAGGVCTLYEKYAKQSLIILAFFFLLSFILLHIPHNLLTNQFEIGSWTSAFKDFAFAGCAFVIAGTLATAKNPSTTDSLLSRITYLLVPIAKYPLAIMMVVFGTEHFIYVSFVASLVPNWIPWHLFWTYFAGFALIAGGIGIIFNIKPRLAANLLGIMLLIWLIILHIPRAIADPAGNFGNEWTSVFEALAYSGILFILGQSKSKHKKSFS